MSADLMTWDWERLVPLVLKDSVLLRHDLPKSCLKASMETKIKYSIECFSVIYAEGIRRIYTVLGMDREYESWVNFCL